jgi:hypothetical protein
MSKPVLELSQGAYDALYLFIDRVSLQFLAYNADAITAAISLWERAEAGSSVRSRKQVITLVQNSVTCPPDTEDSRRVQ